MSDLILDDVKAMCGVAKENTDFDLQIIIATNGAISNARQIASFSGDLTQVVSGDETWDSLEDDEEKLGFLKEYVCLKARMTFDPPTSSTLESAISGRIDELEFRLNMCAGLTSAEQKEVDSKAETFKMERESQRYLYEEPEF